MSKKRRPHKPAQLHRQGMHAPKPVSAPAAESVRDATEIAADLPSAALDAAAANVEHEEVVESSAVASSIASDEAAPGEPGAVAVPASHAVVTEPAAAQAAAPTVVPAAAPVLAEYTPPTQADIRGVLIQVAGARLLLPNATIAEVLSYADPEPVGADAPDWLLGRMRWRGWQLPLIAFGRLAGVAEETAALGSKVVVLKALAGTGRTPYFAMLTQGFPRLVTVSRGGLELEDDNADVMPRGVQARVRLNDNEALLPDLEAVEALVSEALEQAA
jgi:chemosensory pili system protein ChpC